MASPGQRRDTCGHAMALFDSHTKCARCCEKGVGSDACVEKRPCQICDSFSEEQKKQLATPTYRIRKELQKKTDSSPLIDPADVTVLGQVESKGETSSDRGETPSKKSKKTSHKSPSKKKTSKPTDIQSELKSMDDMWSEWFAKLEALFLAKSFTVPVEPVQSSDVVVNDRPFVPPLQQPTGSTGQKKKPTGQVQHTGEKERKKATQPVEAPGAPTATQPVQVPGAV